MTDRERWWLQATVWMEARGEPFAGQQAVAHVILNRLHSRRWGHTIGAVVLAPQQFSAWNTESLTRRTLAYVSEDGDVSWHQVKAACTLATASDAVDPTDGARHYYNPAVAMPFWDHGQTLPRVTIGRHVFVRDVP